MRNAIAKKLQGKEFFGHPSGLFALFFTEMWERFSYYGMRALLVMYMVSYLLKDPVKAKAIIGYPALEGILTHVFGALSVQAMSSQIYGIYTGLVYLAPLFGGYLADRVLGQYRSVYLGGTLMAIGHFLMASEQMFLLALCFLILGNGCFKPNISSQVGSLYAPGDSRRDGAFTIFYMGVNLGAFFSPLICGTLGQKVGWHWGFGAAGVGMMLGLVIYWLGSGLIPQAQRIRETNKVELVRAKMDWEAWRAVGILVVLSIFNIIFWAVYEEQGNVMQLWADQRTNWNFFGWDMPSSWFQAFNPMMIFAFGPVLLWFWAKQNAKKKEPSSITKLGIGCVLLGLGYGFMIVAAHVLPDGAKGSVLWLLGATWLYTIGELYFSPIGLSLFTKVAPPAIVSTMVGVFYLSSFFGNYGTGYIGMFYDRMPKDMFFAMLMVMGVGIGLIYLLLKRPIIRAIGREV